MPHRHGLGPEQTACSGDGTPGRDSHVITRPALWQNSGTGHQNNYSGAPFTGSQQFMITALNGGSARVLIEPPQITKCDAACKSADVRPVADGSGLP